MPIMSYYSYKITRDYGFAPNPFFGYCTLACCKPNIRKKAEIGDWIIGTGAKENKLLNRLIYLMKVTEKLSFEEYWKCERFRFKKPELNGSLVKIHGDNIYFKDNENWCQLDSHHSFPDGMLNEANLKQDTNGKFVLISDQYFYFGNKHLKIAEKYRPICSVLRDYYVIKNISLAEEFVDSIKIKYSYGIHGDPINWKEYNQFKLF